MARKKTTKQPAKRKRQPKPKPEQEQRQHQQVLQSVVVNLSDEKKKKRTRRKRVVKREREPEQPINLPYSASHIVYNQVLPYPQTSTYETPTFKQELKRSILEEMGIFSTPVKDHKKTQTEMSAPITTSTKAPSTPSLPFEESFPAPQMTSPFEEPPILPILGQMQDELKFPRPLTKAEKEQIRQVRKTTKKLASESKQEPMQSLGNTAQEIPSKKIRVIQKPRLTPGEASIGIGSGVPQNYLPQFTEQSLTEGPMITTGFALPTPTPQLFGNPTIITPQAEAVSSVVGVPAILSAPGATAKGDIELPASRIPARPRWDSIQTLSNAYERLTGQGSPGVNKEDLLRILFVELTEEDPSTKTKKEIRTTVRKKLRERGI